MTESLQDSLRAWIELDHRALHENLQYFQAIGKDKIMIPVLKANAYGYGLMEVLEMLEEENISMIACACVQEAITIRQYGYRDDILILGYTPIPLLKQVKQYHLTQTVVDAQYAKAIEDHGERIDVHIAIDTGMHRIGFIADDIDDIMAIYSYACLHITGIYTHLCASDELCNDTFTKQQIEVFQRVVNTLETNGYPVGLTHVSATYGLLHYPEIHEKGARLGIGLFGVLNNEADSKAYDQLKPVLSLYARITSVRHVTKGAYVGYALSYQAQKEETIAAISIGYGDGLPRAFSNQDAYVLVHGQKARIIGRVCTDQALIDVSGIDVQPDDIVTLIGKDHGEEVTIGMWAAWADTITIDVLTRLSERPTRIII